MLHCFLRHISLVLGNVSGEFSGRSSRLELSSCTKKGVGTINYLFMANFLRWNALTTRQGPAMMTCEPDGNAISRKKTCVDLEKGDVDVVKRLSQFS